ncbi:MAG: helix-turn-helix domain-containing protein [Cyclobacteriaceae bacterium]|uniref:helix-turn-helix domain-containing protein n=1 Tax=Reichenbachiella sp. TaxID=2184521 RepID=UPI0032650013
MNHTVYQKELAKYSNAPKTIHTSYNIFQLAKLIDDAVNLAISRRLEGLEIVKKEEKDKLLTIEEVANLLSCSKASVHNYKRDGRLEGFVKVGNRTYIKESDCMVCLRRIEGKGK